MRFGFHLNSSRELELACVYLSTLRSFILDVFFLQRQIRQVATITQEAALLPTCAAHALIMRLSPNTETKEQQLRTKLSKQRRTFNRIFRPLFASRAQNS